MSPWDEKLRAAFIVPLHVLSGKFPPVEYESAVTVRRVRHNGEIKWHGNLLYLSEILAREPLGLKPIDEDQREIRYTVPSARVTR